METGTPIGEVIDEMVSRVREGFSPERIILFGSLARGTARTDSDVDLLVVLRNVENKRQSAIEIRRALADLPVGKDIIVTTPEEMQERGHLVGSVREQPSKRGRLCMSEARNWNDASRWLRYATEDLKTAKVLLQDECFPRHICWLAQQSVEKALKSVFVFLQIDYPRTHDLDLLRKLLPEGWEVKDARADVAALSEWAVESRYPGDWPEATPADAKTALDQATVMNDLVVGDYAAKGFALS